MFSFIVIFSNYSQFWFSTLEDDETFEMYLHYLERTDVRQLTSGICIYHFSSWRLNSAKQVDYYGFRTLHSYSIFLFHPESMLSENGLWSRNCVALRARFPLIVTSYSPRWESLIDRVAGIHVWQMSEVCRINPSEFDYENWFAIKSREFRRMQPPIHFMAQNRRHPHMAGPSGAVIYMLMYLCDAFRITGHLWAKITGRRPTHLKEGSVIWIFYVYILYLVERAVELTIV